MRKVWQLLFSLCTIASAQAQLVHPGLVEAEKARMGGLLSFRSAANIYHGYNIHYHRCFWRVNPKINGYLKGNVLSAFQITADADSIGFNLRAQMQVDSVLYHGNTIRFSRSGDVLYCYKQSGWKNGEYDSLTVFYQGNPQAGIGGEGYYYWDNHMTGPIVNTLSQPYGAAYWWPCKQTLTDKIDSIDLFISTTPDLKAASNGLLVSSDSLNDSTRIYHWRHRYPIVTYLVAIAVSNYDEYIQHVHFDGKSDSLPIVNYVFPQSLSDAQKDLPSLIPVFKLFDSLFGEYPFIREKYGHAQFTWGGGMEHQTMSFMVNFSYDLAAHELAHQWFGDKVTCGSWGDLWLNEGFATYLNALCYRYLIPGEWINRMQGLRNASTSQDNGSVYAKDTVTINRLFSGTLTYNKAAFVLHMLRIKVGDNAFFGALRKFLNAPADPYGFARTADLRAVMEAESGMKLDTFFTRWVYGEGFPYLKINWTQTGRTVAVSIDQQPSHVSVPFFELRIPILFKGTTRDSLIWFEPKNLVWTTAVQLPFEVDTAVFDPEVTVLAKASLGGINLNKDNTGIFTLAPNPARDEVKIIPFNQLATKIEIFDMAGRKVFQTSENFTHTLGTDIVINLSKIGNGTYITKVYTANSVTLLKLNIF